MAEPWDDAIAGLSAYMRLTGARLRAECCRGAQRGHVSVRSVDEPPHAVEVEVVAVRAEWDRFMSVLRDNGWHGRIGCCPCARCRRVWR